jgi:hypothetical protein
MEFDFSLYTASELDSDRNLAKDRVLVFARETATQNMERAICFYGAIGIRWRIWSNAPASWSIVWAWLHPYERRKGHLTKAWPFIMEMFPSPHVEWPLSSSMGNFLKKIGYEKPFLDIFATNWQI